MKYIILSCCLLIGVATSLQAQPPRHDTLHFAQWQQEITRAPVLTGGSQPIVIVPNGQPFCFDKELYLKMTIGSHAAEQAIYLDTHNGLTGVLPPSSHGAVEEIMPELEHFTLSVMSMKGNVYMYKNQKGKNGIEHRVMTGNTQNFLYQSPTATNPGSGVALGRKTEQRAYCDNKITATAYRYDGSPNTFYVYGDRFPEKLHPVKFLGSFGVGYMYTQEGLYLVMEVTFGSSYVRIGSINNVHVCFNPSEFESMEAKFQTNQQAELERNRASADREQAKISGDCAAQKQTVVDYKKGLNDKQAAMLRDRQHGNVYQDSIAQRAMLSMLDPLDNVRLSILNAKLGICLAEHDMAKNPRNEQSDQVKIQCLGDQLSKLQDVETRMTALDHQYASQMARANAEKGKIYWDLLKTMPKCD